MKKMIVLTGIVCLLVGCAFTKQAIQDYKTGKETALVNGEISPKEEATPIANTVGSLPIPFAAAAAPIVLFLATGFFTWQRGANIRKNNNIVTPVVVAKSNMFAGTIQNIANVFTGIFSVASTDSPTTTGSIIQRMWKVALSTIAGAVTFASTNQSFMNFLTGHPLLDAGYLFVTSGVAGLEKGLSSVPPTTTPVVPPTASAT